MGKHIKKIILLLITLFTFSFVLSKNVSAIDALTVGGEALSDMLTTNTAGTAIYDTSSNTLILNNYNGGMIKYNSTEDLTIILEGNNVILPGGDNFGIQSNYAGLKITGSGNLSIEDVEDYGIYVNVEDLEIDGTSISVESSYFGLYTDDGDINIKDSNITVILDAGEQAISASGNFMMDGGSLTISAVNPTETMVIGIHADDFTLSSGNITISDTSESVVLSNFLIEDGTFSANNTGFAIIGNNNTIINGGSIIINAQVAGLFSENYVEINDGYVEINAGAEDASAAIVVAKTTADSDLVIADNMKISPDGLSLQAAAFDYVGTPMDAITIGVAGATIAIDSSLIATTSNVANSVVISPKTIIDPPNTYDGVANWVLLGVVSLGVMVTAAVFIFSKKSL